MLNTSDLLMLNVITEVLDERGRQDAKWGEQNHPDGTGGIIRRVEADEARKACQLAAEDRTVTWRHIMAEEVAEALAEEDPDKLATELVQVAAVAVAWVEAIRRGQWRLRDGQVRNDHH